MLNRPASPKLQRGESTNPAEILIISKTFHLSAMASVLRTTDYVNMLKPIEIITQNIRQLLHPSEIIISTFKTKF